jgi:uncharacterized damage-inducible protein DinB
MRKDALKYLLLSFCALTAVHAADPVKTTGFREEYLTQLDEVEKKVISLAQGVPEDRYSWRPGKGVRSIGEVYVHLASANYGIPIFIGVKPPAGFDQNAEKTVTEKVRILEMLKGSFENARKAASNMSDSDLDKQVKFFGGKMVTQRSVLLLMATHMHEHMGQSIAYARTNGIVPPWSAGGGE